MTVDFLSEVVDCRHPDVLGGQPVIDAEALTTLQELADDDGEFLLELVEMFLGDAAQRVEGMQASARGSDWDAVAGAAHALKSASANLGALPFSRSCAQLELSVRGGVATEMFSDTKRVSEMFSDVQAVLARLQACLGA